MKKSRYMIYAPGSGPAYYAQSIRVAIMTGNRLHANQARYDWRICDHDADIGMPNVWRRIGGKWRVFSRRLKEEGAVKV